MDLDIKTNLERFAFTSSEQARQIKLLLNGNKHTLSLLNTINKSNLVNAINEVLALATARAEHEVTLEDIDIAVQDYFVLHPQSFTYDQGTPSKDWVIVHPLDHYPSVVLTDSAGTRWQAQVSYPARNVVRIQSNVPTTGTAVLS